MHHLAEFSSFHFDLDVNLMRCKKSKWKIYFEQINWVSNLTTQMNLDQNLNPQGVSHQN